MAEEKDDCITRNELEYREQQLEAIAKLISGDPRPAYFVLALNLPVTQAFRDKLADMLMPECWTPRSETDEPPTHRLIVKRLPGRPAISPVKRRQIWFAIHRRGGPTKKNVGRAADQFGISDAAARKIYYEVLAEWTEELHEESEDRSNIERPGMTEEEIEEEVYQRKQERLVEKYRTKKESRRRTPTVE